MTSTARDSREGIFSQSDSTPLDIGFGSPRIGPVSDPFSQALPKDLLSFAIRLTQALSNIPEMMRLKDIWQQIGVRLTSSAQDPEIASTITYFNHSRFDHSRGVGVKVYNWGLALCLNESELKIASAVGCLHDIGVCAFCHVGEKILHNYGFEDFDHDLHALIVASQPSVQEALRSLDLDGRDVVAALGATSFPTGEDEQSREKRARFHRMTRHLKKLGLASDCVLELDENNPGFQDTITRFKRWENLSKWVQDYCDIFDYLVRDTEASPQNLTFLNEIRSLVAEAQNAFYFDDNYELVLSDIRPIEKLVKALKDKELDTVLSITTSWANERLFYDLRCSDITQRDLIISNDVNLLQRLPFKEQEVLLGHGIDCHFSEIFRIKTRLDGDSVPSEVDLQKLLKKEIAKFCGGQVEGHPCVIVSLTPPFKKCFSFTLVEKAISQAKQYRRLETLLQPDTDRGPLTVSLAREKRNPNKVSFSIEGHQQISVAILNDADPGIAEKVRLAVQLTLEREKIAPYYEFEEFVI